MSRRNLANYSKKAVAVIGILVLVLLIRSLVLSIISTKDRFQILKQLEAELAQKNREQAYLTQKLYYAKTDSFVEEQAREKLGLIKEGESVVVDQKVVSLKPVVLVKAVPNWKLWLDLFF